MQIRDRKKEMEDKYLTVVEEHVDRLGEMAKNIQEELQIQDRMVDDLGNRIETAQEHVTNVNTRMKVRVRVRRWNAVDLCACLAPGACSGTKTFFLVRVVSLCHHRCCVAVIARIPDAGGLFYLQPPCGCYRRVSIRMWYVLRAALGPVFLFSRLKMFDPGVLQKTLV